MGGGDVEFRLGTEGQEGCTDFVETGATFKEPPRHSRLPGETAEIHDGAGMGEDVGAHRGGIDNGDGTSGICCHRQRAGIRGCRPSRAGVHARIAGSRAEPRALTSRLCRAPCN